MPLVADTPMMYRQLSCAFCIFFLKYGSSMRFGNFASFSYASVIFCRNPARMMHPPRQICAILAKSSFQLYSVCASVMSAKPCA